MPKTDGFTFGQGPPSRAWEEGAPVVSGCIIKLRDSVTPKNGVDDLTGDQFGLLTQLLWIPCMAPQFGHCFLILIQRRLKSLGMGNTTKAMDELVWEVADRLVGRLYTINRLDQNPIRVLRQWVLRTTLQIVRDSRKSEGKFKRFDSFSDFEAEVGEGSLTRVRSRVMWSAILLSMGSLAPIDKTILLLRHGLGMNFTEVTLSLNDTKLLEERRLAYPEYAHLLISDGKTHKLGEVKTKASRAITQVRPKLKKRLNRIVEMSLFRTDDPYWGRDSFGPLWTP